MPSMLLRTLALACLLVSLDAAAINKCTDASGKTTYTDAPCTGHQKADTVTASKPAMSNPNQASDQGRLNNWLADQDRNDRRDTLNRTIKDKEREVEDLRTKMDRELLALRERKSLARNNLAGATWEESLSTEMQAVATRYNAQIDQTQREIEAARADIKALDGASAGAASPSASK